MPKPPLGSHPVQEAYGSHSDVCTFDPASEWPSGCLLTGMHAPVAPVVLANVHEDLASKIAEDLPGSMLVLGVSGRSGVLAHGIGSELSRMYRRDDVRVAMLPAVDGDLADAVTTTIESSRGKGVVRSIVLALDEVHSSDSVRDLRRAVRLSDRNLHELVVVSICDWTEDDTILSIVSGSGGRTRVFANDNRSSTIMRVPFVPSHHTGKIPERSLRVPASLKEVALSIGPGERVCVAHVGSNGWMTYLAAARLERMVMRKGGSVRFLQSRLSRDGAYACLPSRERMECDRLAIVTENARPSPVSGDLHLDLRELSKGE